MVTFDRQSSSIGTFDGEIRAILKPDAQLKKVSSLDRTSESRGNEF